MFLSITMSVVVFDMSGNMYVFNNSFNQGESVLQFY